jgi:peptide/nickel transport system ATP-binding protein
LTHALLELRGLVKHYRLPRERLFAPAPLVHALRGVSLTVQGGTSLGIVGESGSGKSTLARQAMALEAPTEGSVLFLGRDLNTLTASELQEARRDFQMVFQDPYGSLDPRQRVRDVVAEPLFRVDTRAIGKRVADSLDAVGLRASDADKYPYEFSGGQRQRIAIARALITRPKLIVADEPVSALDVSVQAQVLNLLEDLQHEFGVTYLFISHDLAVVDHVCDEVAVMYAGRVVEQGAPQVLFRAAAHPYTQALMRALPRTDELDKLGALSKPNSARVSAPQSRIAAIDDLAAVQTACSFASRCPFARARCQTEIPELRPLTGDHMAACHFAESIMLNEEVQG